MEIKNLFEEQKYAGFSLIETCFFDKRVLKEYILKSNFKIVFISYNDTGDKIYIKLQLRYDVFLNLEVRFFNSSGYQEASLFIDREFDGDTLHLNYPLKNDLSFFDKSLESYIFDSISFYLIYCLNFNTDKDKIMHFFSYSGYLEADSEYFEDNFKSIIYYSEYVKSLLYFSDSSLLMLYFSKLNLLNSKDLVIYQLSLSLEVSAEVISDRLKEFIGEKAVQTAFCVFNLNLFF